MGLPVRNLSVGAVVGFELSGDELELLEEDVALCSAAVGAEGVEFATQCIQCRLKVVGFGFGQVLEDVGGVFGGEVEL